MELNNKKGAGKAMIDWIFGFEYGWSPKEPVT